MNNSKLSKQIFQKFAKQLLIILLISSQHDVLRATHIMGGDLTYKEIDTSQGRYRFTLSLYRDCSGIQFGAEQLRIRTATINTMIPLNTIPVKTEVTPICLPPDVASKPITNCPSGAIGLYRGVERWVYTADYTLGKNIGWAYVGWGSCCRNTIINTIVAAGGAGMWIQAVINTNYRNNSPVFTTPPIPYWCRLKVNTYSHGTVDSFDPLQITLPNGVTTIRDSFSYKFYTPFTDEAANTNSAVNFNNSAVTFVSPLNHTNFLFTTSGVQMDPQTGAISCIPSIEQDAVMAVAVQEWRAIPNGNGYSRVLVGYVCRDIQFNVSNTCDPITISGIISDSTRNALFSQPSIIITEVGRKNINLSFRVIGSPNRPLKSKVGVMPSKSLFKNANYTQVIKSGGGVDTIIGSIKIDSVLNLGESQFILELYNCSAAGMRQNQFFNLKFVAKSGACSSVGDTPINSNLNIRRVTITGGLDNLNNQTPCNSHLGSQGTGIGVAGRYSNFTNSTVPKTKLIKGSTFNLEIKDTACMSGNHYYTKTVFIDWNKNNDFTDAGERYNISSSPFNLPTENINITIPANTPLGLTKMRVVTRMDTPASNLMPCGPSLNASMNQGETEDYEIEIIENFGDCKIYKQVNYTKIGKKFHFVSSGPTNVISPYVVRYNWTFSNGSSSTAKNPILDSLPHGKLHWAKLVVCVDSGTINICCDSSRIDSIENCLNSCSITKINDTLRVNPINGIAPYTYLWSNGSNSKSIKTNASGTQFAYVTDSMGCVSECSFMNQTVVNCTNPSILVISAGLATIFPNTGSCTGSCYPNLFNTTSIGGSSANRYIYSASELLASGFSAGYIKAISFNITEVNTPTFDTLDLRIGSTATINASTFSGSLIPVYKGVKSVTAGWNKFTLSAPFFWDGVSNIIIEAHTQSGTVLVGNKIMCFGTVTGNKAAYKISNTLGVKAENAPGSYISAGNVACLPQLQIEYCNDTVKCSSYRNFAWNNIGSSYTFYNTPNIPVTFNPTYYWSFGNGQTSAQAQPTVSLNSNSTYQVKLVYCLRDTGLNIICCDSFIKMVVTPNPSLGIPCNIAPNFTWTSLNDGTIHFQDSTFPNIGQMYTYHWTFGDGTSSNQKNPIKVYSTNGNKLVCLRIRRWLNGNNLHCEDTICKTINVTNVVPCNRLAPKFSFQSIGMGQYSFQNQTNMSNFNLIYASYQILPTGATYSTPNAFHTFTTTGIYNIIFTVTAFDVLSGMTCSRSTSQTIFVNPSLCGCFKAYNSATVFNRVANFTNISVCVDTNTKYLYKFGNGDTSTNPNPTYTYPLPGLYRTVMYIRRTLNGVTCKDSFIRILQVTSTHPCKDSGYAVYFNYSCPTYINPVCGCDSITYANYCEAGKKGVKQYTYGPCANDTNYVKVCGYVVNDINRNCSKDSSDININNIAIKFNTTPVSYAYTNSAGYYQIYLPKGTHVLTQVLGYTNPAIHQLCPASNASITVNATTGGLTYCNNNFYDTMNSCPDLSVSIARFRPITPGFLSQKKISYSNRGATTISGVVLKYRFLSSLIVHTATTPTYSVSGNVLSWNLGSLPPYSNGSKFAIFDVPTTLPLGTTVIDSAWIEPVSGDCNPSNNHALYYDTCVGSWDPNDKAAAPANNIDTGVKVLDYHIRFQNTGTAPAHNVRIEDKIDDNFEKASLKVLDYSHKMNHYFDDNGKLYFEFPNIMLPDSGTDYEASQGYVTYSIHMKKGLAVGTKLKNTAEIYFDFNEPIITNTTVNTITLKSSGAINLSKKDWKVILFPNPTKNIAYLNLELVKASKISYTLFDIQGRAVLLEKIVENKQGLYSEELNLEFLQSGIYILNIKINDQETSVKIIKE
jgi:hypothetical protein